MAIRNTSRIAGTKRAVKPVIATSPESSRPACAGMRNDPERAGRRPDETNEEKAMTTQLLIGGRWIDARSGAIEQVRSPFDGSVVGEVPTAGAPGGGAPPAAGGGGGADLGGAPPPQGGGG